MSAPTTLIMIVALNEEATIGDVIRSVKVHLKDCDVLVVDGYSRDRTVERSLENGASVIQVAKSFGIGGAVEAGILYADRKGYSFLARIDGDGQHRPSDISRLLEILYQDKADFIVGSRFLGNAEYKPNILRNSSIFLISRLMWLLFGVNVADCTSGCQLLNREAIEYFSRDPRFEYSEARIIWTAHKAGFRIKEEFINMAPRQAGVSSFSPRNAFLYMFKNLVDILFSWSVTVSPRRNPRS